MLEEEFLSAFGDEEITRKQFVPGEDRSGESERVEQALQRLRWESDNGRVDDDGLYRSRLAGLASQKAELTANVVVPARVESIGTGRTYREAWNDPSTDRRQVLRESRMRLVPAFSAARL